MSSVSPKFKLIDYVLDPNGREWISIETLIDSGEQLEGALRAMMIGTPRVVDLVAPNGDVLNIGVGGPFGYAAFATAEMQSEGRAISAWGAATIDTPESVEFEMGGTPTPVTRESLVRSDDLLSIARFFLETGEPHSSFSWD